MAATADRISGHELGMTDPLSKGVAITPADDADLTYVTRAIWIGTGGDLKVTLVEGDTVELRNVPVGLIPVRARRVWATTTGAAAALMVGLR